MAQTEMGWRVSFSLSAKNWAKSKEQSIHCSAQSLASRRRSGCSLAEPYLPHECHQSTRYPYSSLARGTFLFGLTLCEGHK